MTTVINKIKRSIKILFTPSFQSYFHSGPRKPLVDVADNYANCQLVKLDNDEYGALVGPYIKYGRWDGSYVIIFLKNQNIVTYLYLSKFAWTGLTIKEAREAQKIRKEQELAKQNSKVSKTA